MKQSLRHYFYKENRIFLGLTFVMLVLDTGVNLWISFLLQKITDISIDGTLESLNKILFITVLSFFFMGLIWMIKRFVLSKFLYNALRQYKNAVFQQIVSKNMQSFMKEPTAKYISALTNDVASIETNYLKGLLELFVEVIGFFGALLLMLYYSPLLTGIAMALAMVPVVVSVVCSNKIKSAEIFISNQNEHFVSMVKDALLGFPIIKGFQAEQEITQLFDMSNDALEKGKYKKRMISEFVQMLGAGAGFIAQIGVFLFGTYFAISGKGITAGVLIAFVNLMNLIVRPIGRIPELIGNRKAAKALIDKIECALSENVQTNGIIRKKSLDKVLEAENVSFSYGSEHDAVTDFSFRFEKGKSYAIVGTSGSGKTTLLNLLLGYFDNYSGKIKYDDQELHNLTSTSIHNLAGVIQQNVFLFDQSIKDNITLFKSFSDEQFKEAVRLSGLDNLIKEKGENYLCGENGCNLSGGERQRISIARSLLLHTPILMIDEATASLDAMTSVAVIEAILNLKNITKIVVTHKLEEKLLCKYDEILVMKNGRLQEHGTFNDLLSRKEYFYSMYHLEK